MVVMYGKWNDPRITHHLRHSRYLSESMMHNKAWYLAKACGKLAHYEYTTRLVDSGTGKKRHDRAFSRRFSA